VGITTSIHIISTHIMLDKRQYIQPDGKGNGNRAIGAAVYYGITAAIIVGIAVSVIVGKILYRRKQRRAYNARIDVERQEQARRGEAAGLPTYLDHGRTVSVPMPTLPQAAYDPEAAAYHARIDGQQHGSWANAPHDPSLPSYDLAPPKYDFTQDSAAGTTATTTTAAPVVTTPGGGMEMAETGRSAPVLTTPLPRPAAPLGASDNAPSMFPVSSPATAPTSPGEMHDVSLADRPSLTPRVSANATTGTILRQ